MIPTKPHRRYRLIFKFDRFNLVIEKLMIPTETLQLIREHAQYRFNLVIEKLMIPTHNQKGRCIVLQLLSFNLVIEKLMIPTSHSVARNKPSGSFVSIS